MDRESRLGPSWKVYRGLSLRKHSGGRERALRPSTQSDRVNSRLGAGNCRKIEIHRERLRDIRNKIRRVYHGGSRPRRKDRMDA